MSVEFLFEVIFILTFVCARGTKVTTQFANISSSNSSFNTATTKFSFHPVHFNVGELLIKDKHPNILKQLENVRPTWNQTRVPLFLNLIVNLNFINENDKKSNNHKRLYGKTKRNIKSEEINIPTKNKMIQDDSQKTVSENLGHIFEKIKLKMELQRKKRNIEFQNNEDAKLEVHNVTNSRNKIQDISTDAFPKMSLLNDDKELDVTKWLKNWKDILAVNPILSTDTPTKPEVDFIDEWKYSYKVTLYNSETYNVSNYICSGLLVSPQWVLTSVFCSLGDDVILLIGVHALPAKLAQHNRYSVLKKVYSLSDNLELIQMDRPVQWTFKAPDIRGVKVEEMDNLLRRGKCNLLSWVPVDIEKNIFELRQYPQLTLQTEGTRNLKKNCVKATTVQQYSLSRKDIGSPVLCDNTVTGILLNIEEEENMTVEVLCPVLEWITFFTREGSYFEVTARKYTLRSEAVTMGLAKDCLLVHFLMVYLIWMT
ncbi:uncharacterized protein LOC123676562 [Harmonia axyridis]|uniref:uncharacterized protein LOC123676562 n=1 Tax=Harmonia axyridis TaxID=115357 RepID=UPI001E2758D4|nr:uncharacterized protein LOC123676562 [Harmonia axyridis]